MNRKLRIEELDRADISTYQSQKKSPITIVLDNIRSLNNIGSVFRTSDAFAIERVILCGITAQPPHKDINRTALGATESVEWMYFEHTIDAIKELRSTGHTLMAVEQTEKSTRLDEWTYNFSSPLAIVMGNEVFGVDQEVIDACDGSLEVPMVGTKHSLNISVCAGIVLWKAFEMYRGN